MGLLLIQNRNGMLSSSTYSTSFECSLVKRSVSSHFLLLSLSFHDRRIVKSRTALEETIASHSVKDEEESKSFSIPIPEITLPKEEDDPSAVGPKLYVRDDGTVDWDGALQDRSALQNFGTAVWARINGQNPELVDEEALVENNDAHAPSPVTVKIEETEEIRRERDALDALKLELSEMEVEHTALLNSGTLPAGNVKYLL